MPAIYDKISALVKEVHCIHVKNRPDVYVDVENPFTEERFKEILNDDKTKIFVAEDGNNEIIAYISEVDGMNFWLFFISIPCY